MCGRFALYHSIDVFNSILHLKPGEFLPFTSSYNIAPSQVVPILSKGEDVGRKWYLSSWGFIPHWAEPTRFKAKLFNARSETASEKPAFRYAMRMNRCLVPASGYFEWKSEGKSKAPYFVRRNNGQPMVFAGLQSLNSRRSTIGLTHTILTTESNKQMRSLHHRMPVILNPEQFGTWLDPLIYNTQVFHKLFAPYPLDELEVFPVPHRVGDPKLDDVSLIKDISAKDTNQTFR